ncbi:unnamed protein product, partial [Iphiclides podalirius]
MSWHTISEVRAMDFLVKSEKFVYRSQAIEFSNGELLFSGIRDIAQRQEDDQAKRLHVLFSPTVDRPQDTLEVLHARSTRLSRHPVHHCVQYIMSKKGNTMLQYQGYTYHLKGKAAIRRIWRCSRHCSYHCRATVTTVYDTVVKVRNEHNHGPINLLFN